MPIPLLPEFDSDGYQVQPTTAVINDVITAVNAALSEAGLLAALADTESSVSAAVALLGGGSAGVMPWPVLTGSTIDSRTVYAADASEAAVTANLRYAVPLIIRQSCTIDTIGVRVVTGSAGVVRFGLYDVIMTAGPTFGAPGALIGDYGTGSTEYGGNNIRGYPDVVVEPGVYYIVAAFQATPTVQMLTPLSQGPGGENYADAFRNGCVYASGGWEALPDPFGSIGGKLSVSPRLWVEISY